MLLNGIDFPNTIVDAIKENKLVVFAGAGVSAGKPTSLPNFKQLAEVIADGTGERLNKNDPCEVFLGSIKAKGIDVNARAAELLSRSDCSFNRLHEAIIDLFKDISTVRIVTTNYDNMFEQVFENRGITPNVYNAPALPLGNDVNGIIHLHGNASNPLYMVVTDEDFGRAYLTDGYASRFLVQLFESYTVLFIGYSYNDAILRYLTRAVVREKTRSIFILTDSNNNNWSMFGINPIYYPKRSFKKMRVGLEKLGAICKRSLLDWKTQFEEMKEATSLDLTTATEIDYCLENIENTRTLAKSVTGKEWLHLLEQKGVFKNLFSNTSTFTDTDNLWADWLVNTFVGTEDKEIIRLIYRYDNQINTSLIKKIINKIIFNGDMVSNKALSEYLVWVEPGIIDSYQVLFLIQIAVSRKLPETIFRLFIILLKPNMFLGKSFGSGIDSIEYNHRITVDFYYLQEAWSKCKNIITEAYGRELLLEAFRTLERIHNNYLAVGQITNGHTPWNFDMVEIEDRDENHEDDPLAVIALIISELFISLEEKDADIALGLYKYGIKSNCTLLKKIILKCLRESNLLSADEKLDFLLNYVTLDFPAGKEQEFLLVASVFDSLSDCSRNAFLDSIEMLAPSPDKWINESARYNWCVWLKRKCKKNSRINDLIEKISSVYDFKPREHPELNYEFSVEKMTLESIPFSMEELQNMDDLSLLSLFLDNEGEINNDYTRWGLLNSFTSSIKNNLQWTNHVIDLFIKDRVKKEDLWICLIQAITDAGFAIDDNIFIIEKIANNIHLLPDTKYLSRLLFKTVKRNDMEQVFLDYEVRLLRLSEIIWKNRKEIEDFDLGIRTIDLTINTTVGCLISTWIRMVYYLKEQSIPERYKTKFEDGLQIRTWERNTAVCVLAGHFNFFFIKDSAWALDSFATILSGHNKEDFIPAWEGLTFFSRSINRDSADAMAGIIYNAITQIHLLEGESRKGLLNLYLLLIAYVIKKPTLKAIPRLYKYASDDDKETFVNGIKNRLRHMDVNEVDLWWNAWLKAFLRNRTENKPDIPNEKELEALFELATVISDDHFDEAVIMLCKGKCPSRIDFLFLHTLNERNIAATHPNSSAKLLTYMLDSGTEFIFADNFFSKYIGDNKMIRSKEKNELMEALLKRGIAY